MKNQPRLSRRAFMQTAGVAAGCMAVDWPLVRPAMAAETDFVARRQQSAYRTDAQVYKIRKSQDNPMVQKLYDPKAGFLNDDPCGHMSHHLLHTHYIDRSARIAALKDKGFEFAL